MGSKVKINKGPSLSLRALFSRAWQSLPIFIVVMIFILTASPSAFANGIDFSDSQGYFGIPHDNVGIGSSAPGQKLDVQGTVRATAFIAGAGGITLGGVNNISWPAGGSNYWLNTAAAGNVGISTTNTVGIGTTSGVGAGLVVMNGNVGIGTWAPQAALDVGTGRLTGGTSSKTYRNYIDMAPPNGFASTDIIFQGGDSNIGNSGDGQNVFRSGSIAVVGGANDLFFQAIPPTTSGYGYLESADAAGMVVGTYKNGGGGGPILFRPNRTTQVQISNAGGLSVGNSYTSNDAGAGNMIISGNVGIGTVTPFEKLDMGGSGWISIQDSVTTNSNGTTGITWYTPIPTNYGIYQTSGSWSAPNYQQLDVEYITGIILDPGSAYGKSYIDIPEGGLHIDSGNVGIGSATPGQLLDVQGTVRATAFIAGAGGITLGGVNNTSWPAGGSNYWLNTAAAGNVGISTTNTVGIGTTSGVGAGLVVMNGNVGIGTWVPQYSLGINGNLGVGTLVPGGSLVVTSNGNVGINITNPTGQLVVNDSGSVSGDDATVEIKQPSSAVGNKYADLGFYNSNGLIANLSVLGTGYPTSNLWQPNDFITLVGQDNAGSNEIFLTNTGGTIKFGTGGYASSDERMRIGANGGISIGNSYVSTDPGTGNMIISGNVGIGSANPGQALDVNGTVRATAFIAGAGGITLGGVNNTSWPVGGSNYWLNTAAAGNVGISTMNTVGIGTTSGIGAGLVVMNGNVGIGTWVPNKMLTVGNNLFTVSSAGALVAQTVSIGSTVGAVPAIVVSGGTNPLTINGAYAYAGQLNGKNYYQNGGWYIWYYAGSYWVINNDLGTWGAYGAYTASGASTPPLGSGWSTNVITGSIVTSAGSSGSFLTIDSNGNVTTNGFLSVGANSYFGGNVGIGVTGPQYSLDVISDIGNSTLGSLYLQDQGGGVYTSHNVLDDGNGNIGIGTSVANDSLIVASGNVGIGSVAPGQILDVQGTVRMMGLNITSGAGSGKILTSDANGNGTWAAANGGSNYWLNTAAAGNVGISTMNTVGIGTTSGIGAGLVVMNGNVGIGTWVPTGALQVSGNVIFGANPGASLAIAPLNLVNNGSSGTIKTQLTMFNGAGSAGAGSSMDFYTYNEGNTVPAARFGSIDDGNYSNSFVFSTKTQGASGTGSLVERLRLSSLGYLGINDAAPAAFLSVVGNAAIGYGSGQTAPSNGLIVNGNVGIGTTTPVGGLTVMNGNVGIGTWVPGVTLDVNGSFRTSGSTGNTTLNTSGGNVGIGSANPGMLLDVAGNIRGTQLVDTGVTASSLVYANSSQQLAPVTIGSGLTLSGATLSASGGTNYWLNTAAAGNVGISTMNTVGIGTTSGIGAGLVVMNGNVGIGTWVPERLFKIVGDATHSANGASSQISISGTASASNKLNIGYDTSSNAGYIEAVNEGSTWQNLGLQPTNGSVGIGFLPGSGFTGGKLAVAGSAVFGSDYAGSVSPATNTFLVEGNVGVGSTAPGQVMDVQGTVRATGIIAGAGGITLGGVNNTSWSAAGSNYWNYSASGNIGVSTIQAVGIGTTFVGGTGEAALSVMNGNVGIGTWVPSAALSIGGGNLFLSPAGSNTTTPTSFGFSPALTTGNAVRLQFGDTSNAVQLAFNDRLQLYSYWGMEIHGNDESSAPSFTGGTTTDAALSIFGPGNGTSDILRLYSSNGVTEYMGINSNGNVGIGTTTPAGALTVMNGNVGIGTWVPAAGLDVETSGNSYFGGNVGIGSVAPSNGFVYNNCAAHSGQAACWATNGAAGYCTTVVSSSGGCTCTAC